MDTMDTVDVKKQNGLDPAIAARSKARRSAAAAEEEQIRKDLERNEQKFAETPPPPEETLKMRRLMGTLLAGLFVGFGAGAVILLQMSLEVTVFNLWLRIVLAFVFALTPAVVFHFLAERLCKKREDGTPVISAALLMVLVVVAITSLFLWGTVRGTYLGFQANDELNQQSAQTTEAIAGQLIKESQRAQVIGTVVVDSVAALLGSFAWSLLFVSAPGLQLYTERRQLENRLVELRKQRPSTI